MTTEANGNKIITLVHRIFTPTGVKPGGGDYLTSYLEDRGFEITYIENPLFGSHCSRLVKDKQATEYNIPFSGVLRWFVEIPFNVYKTLSCGKFDLIVAVDPLNFISAFLVNLVRKTPVQFHAVDYSEKRFGIKILDVMYKQIYYFALNKADYVTYVSVNMRDIVNLHVPDIAKTTFLPNSPEFKKIPKVDPQTKNNLELVYTKSFISDTEVDILTDLVQIVREKHPTILLNVVGKASPKLEETIKLYGLADNVTIHGLVDYRTNINIVASSYIGLAWYENVRSFEKYADSLKIREYAAAGLPVLCNGNITTAFEAEERGLLLLCKDAQGMSEGIEKLISDHKLYKEMREKALAWAKEYDKTTLLDNLYKFL